MFVRTLLSLKLHFFQKREIQEERVAAVDDTPALDMAGLPRRIIKETQRLMQEPVPGISAVPDDGNARYFHVVVAGPEGSPFEGGVFKLELFLPEDYPMSAPKVGEGCPRFI